MKLSDMDADTVLQEIPDDETLAQKVITASAKFPPCSR